jgi:hypothetical protein
MFGQSSASAPDIVRLNEKAGGYIPPALTDLQIVLSHIRSGITTYL